MSEGRTASGPNRRAGSGLTRLARAWRALPPESRRAAVAALALFLTLFLPWYQVTLIAPAKSARLESASAAITGWGAFSFVEAAVLLVAAAVLTLLFQRAEGRAFHLPGGDGGVITAAGLWTCVLIVWRIFDKQGATTHGPSATSSGVEWGIFIALAAGAFLAYTGSRIRAAHRPEPPLPGEDRAPPGSGAAVTVADAPRATTSRATPPRRRPRPPRPAPGGYEAPPPPARDQPRRRASAAELFDRVVPDDPPTMRMVRNRRIDEDATTPLGEPPPRPADDQLTIPLGEDATVPLPLDEDATLPLGNDATLPLGHDGTLPLDESTKRH